MTLFLKLTAIGLLFFYIFNIRELNAVALSNSPLDTECSEYRRHLQQRIEKPTADEVLREFCPEFPCAGLRRDWIFVTDSVNQRLGKEREREKKYWSRRAFTLNISNNPKNVEVPIISDGSRPEADVLWEIFPKELPAGFRIDWLYIRKVMKANGYCPILYKKDGTQAEHKKYWGYYYGNEAKARLGVKNLKCPPSRKQKKPTVTCDGDKIILHVPFRLTDDSSDSAEGVVAKDKEYIESSEKDDSESSDSSDENYGKKRSRSKTTKDKTRKKRPHIITPASASFLAPAPTLTPSHHGLPVISKFIGLATAPTIIMPVALNPMGAPLAIKIPGFSEENKLDQSYTQAQAAPTIIMPIALNPISAPMAIRTPGSSEENELGPLYTPFEDAMREQGISPSDFVFTPSMYTTPIEE